MLDFVIKRDAINRIVMAFFMSFFVYRSALERI
jgi:hypothetical protein